MFRWWHEFWNPADKCKRVGHRPCLELWRGLVEGRHTLPCRVKRRRKVCSRCHAILTKWKITKETTYTSVSLPNSHWEKLEDTGEFCESRTFRGINDRREQSEEIADAVS